MIKAYVAGDYPLAIESAEKCLDRNSKSVSALWTISDSYRLLKDYDQAIVYGEKAFASDSTHIDTLQLLSNLYFERRDYRSAYDYVCKAIAVSEETDKVLRESIDRVTQSLSASETVSFPTQTVRNAIADEQERVKEWSGWAGQFKAWYETTDSDCRQGVH